MDAPAHSDVQNGAYRATSFPELLQYRAAHTPDKLACLFLRDGEEEGDRLTYAQLDARARAIASTLQSLELEGERVLLVYPSGVEYIAAFLGCLYARVVAIPAYPPGANMHASRLQRVMADAQADTVLTSADQISVLETRLNGEGAEQPLRFLASDAMNDDRGWRLPPLDRETLAYLQYTSGSTGSPKGVMVSHGNLLHNCQLYAQASGQGDEAVYVSWLPLFHDLGLIMGALQPLYLGGTTILMPSVSFIQKPLRWLAAISRYRGTTSCGPNFGYAHCVNQIAPDQCRGLDLSSWTVALNGAEPVHADTLHEFSGRFGEFGFQAESFFPAYGMAETTLIATCGRSGRRPVLFDADTEALEQGRLCVAEEGGGRLLVSCGHSWLEQEVRVVDPQSGEACADGTIGEIWVSGGSVTQGYWQRPEETRETFQATIHGEGDKRYLRTGDLGVYREGEIYIAGRLKDLIIIRGANHYPQDIEHTVEQCDPDLRPGCGAAFSVTTREGEALVVVYEVKRDRRKQIDPETAIRHVREAVAAEHGIEPHAVVLLQPASVPKTSSGKIQRSACRAAYLEDQLKVFAAWAAPARQDPAVRPDPKSASLAAAISNWLVARFAQMTGIPESQISTTAPFAQFGLDSVAAVRMTGQLAEWLGRDLSPTLIYDYPNITMLAQQLGSAEHGGATAASGVAGRTPVEPIAIVGYGCRLPGADTPEALWELLSEGGDGIGSVPSGRWDSEKLHEPGPGAPGKINNTRGGFLSQVDQFDAGFFGIAPREAQSMDPQQRLLLEVTWEALERAGIAADRIEGSNTGAFIGICNQDYAMLRSGRYDALDAYCGTGGAPSIAANRLSYVLDLRGPSVAVDTACSSSLVAIHQACQSLRGGECDLALAGGVNLLLVPDLSIVFSQARMLAPDGTCKTFDAAADGYVRSEGCGVVVLKRLADAQRDGDRILALIRSSAVNQDGRSNGLTAPNGAAQQRVIRAALDQAGVAPSEIGYVEAHGTGTPLGDPIEVNALKAVLLDGRRPNETCWIGSIKANIGHLEAAAGVAGVLKVVEMLRHWYIPPQLHLSRLNPLIEIDHTPLAISGVLQPWTLAGRKRRYAGVSSFGFGGSNAHLVLEEPPQRPAARAGTGLPRLLPLSARSEAALRQLAAAYAADLGTAAAADVPDICHTAAIGRTHFPHRFACVADTAAGLISRLSAYAEGRPDAALPAGAPAPDATPPRIAFLFTGQGAQYAGMGQGLYTTYPVFQEAVDRCDRLLRERCGLELLPVLFGDRPELIHRTAYTQPAMFVLQYALCELWRAWGVRPDWVAGHSIGEYAAACCSGVLALPDALELITLRGRLMEGLPDGGGMYSLEGDGATIAGLVAEASGVVDIAAENGPRHRVIAGDLDALSSCVAEAERQGIKCKRLQVSHAFHSSLMEPMLETFRRAAHSVTFQDPQTGFVSSVTGREESHALSRADYWVDQVRRPVRFAAALETLQAQGAQLLIEIGPATTLLGLAAALLPAAQRLPSLRSGSRDAAQMLESLAALYMRGLDPVWSQVNIGTGYRRVALPTYPFERRRYWYDERMSFPAGQPGAGATGFGKPTGHPLLGARMGLAGTRELRFVADPHQPQLHYLADHQVGGQAILPAAAVVEMAIAAAREWGIETPCIAALDLLRPVLLDDTQPVELQIVLSPTDAGELHFGLYTQARSVQSGDSWTQHATGRIAPWVASGETFAAAPSERQGAESIDPDRFYARLEGLGLGYGPAFRGITQLTREGSRASGVITLPAGTDTLADRYALHPALLDAALQVAGAVLPESELAPDSLLMPVAIGEVRYHRPAGSEVRCEARLAATRPEGQRGWQVDLTVTGSAGDLVAELNGLHLQPVATGTRPHTVLSPEAQLVYLPCWRPLDPAARQPGARPGSGLRLLLCDDPALTRHLQRRLGALGQHSLVVSRGSSFRRKAKQHYEIDYRNPGDYQRLFGVRGPARDVVLVLDLRALTLGDTADRDWTIGQLEADLDRLNGDALGLLQALEKLPEPPALVLATRGAVAVDDQAGDRCDFRQAALHGLLQSVAAEHPEWDLTLLDLDPACESVDADCSALLADLASGGALHRIAWRRQQPYVDHLDRYGMADDPTVNSPFKPDASYLITGGLGGLGLRIAERAARCGARSLLLLGRRGPTADAAARIQRLEAAGVQVTVGQVDVADADALGAFLARLNGSLPPLRGVIHTAGAVDDALLADQHSDRFGTAMKPKVSGAWNLHRCTADRDLDLFVLYSSAASLIGSAGQANYAAANACLDALAHARRAAGLPALSVNWGPWAETGMAQRLGLLDHLAAAGIPPLAPDEALDVLERLLGQAPPQVAVMRVDWPTFIRQRGWQDPPQRYATVHSGPVPDQSPITGSTEFNERLRHLPQQEGQAILVDYLHRSAGQLLRLDGGQLDELLSQSGNFRLNELGFDSLMGVELRNRVMGDFGVDVPIHHFIGGATVVEIAQLIHQEQSLRHLLMGDGDTAQVSGEMEVVTL